MSYDSFDISDVDAFCSTVIPLVNCVLKIMSSSGKEVTCVCV